MSQEHNPGDERETENLENVNLPESSVITTTNPEGEVEPEGPESHDSITEQSSKSPKKGEAEIIRLSTSRGRRGSSSFLTTDDQVVISFDKGRRLSSICTASSYDQ